MTLLRTLIVLALPALGRPAIAAPADYLPTAADLPGWSQEEKPSTFTQDTLWDLMDGGAEVYLEYGVEGAASVRYKHPGKGGVQVEAYAMKDPAAAFGIYSFNARVKGSPAQIGDDSVRTNYFVLARKGACFFSVTAITDPTGTLAGCLEIARAIAARIPEAGGRPEILSRLPALPGGSVHVVYLRGSLGLLNLYPFDASDPFRPVEGAAAESEDTQFFVLRQADEKEAAARAESAWAVLSSNPKYKVDDGGHGARSLTDGKGRHLILVRDGACNLIAIGPDEAVLRGLLEQALGAALLLKPR